MENMAWQLLFSLGQGENTCNPFRRTHFTCWY